MQLDVSRAEQRSMAEFEHVRKKEAEDNDAERACAVASGHRPGDHRQGEQRWSTTAKKSQNSVPIKERITIPRQLMPEPPADERAHNCEEVNLGFSPELAQQEAVRCLECAKPTRTVSCPVGVKVKEFVELMVVGDFLGAAAKISEDNVLPQSPGESARRKITVKASACCPKR